MGKKSKKGVSRAGVKKHPPAGQSKARTKSVTNSNSSNNSVMSHDSVSIASAPDMLNLKSSAMAATGAGPAAMSNKNPPPLDVLNFVNTLMMQQQLQQQQQQQAEAAAAVGAGVSNQNLCNKENSAATSTTTADEMHNLEEVTTNVAVVSKTEQATAAVASPRTTTPMVVTLDESMDEATIAALIVEKIGQVSSRSNSTTPTPATTNPSVATPTLNDEKAIHLSKVEEVETNVTEQPSVVLSENEGTVTPLNEITAPKAKADAVQAAALLEKKIEEMASVAAKVVDSKVEISNESEYEKSPTEKEKSQPNDAIESTPVPEMSKTLFVDTKTKSAEDGAATMQLVEATAEADEPKTTNDKVDVWSTKLREVVETTTPDKAILDVTPIKKPKQQQLKLPDGTERLELEDDDDESATTPALNLDAPSPREYDDKKNDCGCIIS